MTYLVREDVSDNEPVYEEKNLVGEPATRGPLVHGVNTQTGVAKPIEVNDMNEARVSDVSSEAILYGILQQLKDIKFMLSAAFNMSGASIDD